MTQTINEREAAKNAAFQLYELALDNTQTWRGNAHDKLMAIYDYVNANGAALTEALTRVDELESALRTARDDFLRFRRGATNYNQQEGLWAAEKRCDQSLSRTTLSKGITE